MTEPAAIARAIADRYAEAVFARDVDAVAALYAEEAVVFDAWASWRHDGLGAWRPTLQSWLGGLGDERVRVTFDGLTAHGAAQGAAWGSADMIAASAIVRYAGQSNAGEPRRAIENRLTWLLVRDAGAWLIAHEHTSAPLDPDTGKGLLER